MFKQAEQLVTVGEPASGNETGKKYHVLPGGSVLEERNPDPNSFGSDVFPGSDARLESRSESPSERAGEDHEVAIEAIIQELFPEGLDEAAMERVVLLLETAMQELVPEHPAVGLDGRLVAQDEVAEPVLAANDSEKSEMTETLLAKIRQHPKAVMFLNAVALCGAISTQNVPEAQAGNRNEIKRMYGQADDQYMRDMARFSINNRSEELRRYQDWERQSRREQYNTIHEAHVLSSNAVRGFERSCVSFSTAILTIQSEYKVAFLNLSRIADPTRRKEVKKQLYFSTMERVSREELAFKTSSIKVSFEVRAAAEQAGRGEQKRADEYINEYKDIKTLRTLLPSVKFRLDLKKELEGMGVTFEKDVLEKAGEAAEERLRRQSSGREADRNASEKPDGTVVGRRAGNGNESKDSASADQDKRFLDALLGR
jgi:hypothetical protein